MAGMARFDAAGARDDHGLDRRHGQHDASFIVYSPMAHYVAIVFMILAALPFVRFVQLASGTARPLLARQPGPHLPAGDRRDRRVRSRPGCVLVLAAAARARRCARSLFNIVSVITGTGFTSTDYNAWGPLAMTLFFVIGLIGGCSGSTVCSVKIFRYQLLFSAISAQVNQLHSPSRVFTPRYEGRPVAPDVMDSVIAFFMLFYLTLAVERAAAGADRARRRSPRSPAPRPRWPTSAPGLGPEIGPVGNFAGLPDAGEVGADRHHAARPAGDHVGAGDLLGRLLARLSD